MGRATVTRDVTATLNGAAVNDLPPGSRIASGNAPTVELGRRTDGGVRRIDGWEFTTRPSAAGGRRAIVPIVKWLLRARVSLIVRLSVCLSVVASVFLCVRCLIYSRHRLA